MYLIKKLKSITIVIFLCTYVPNMYIVCCYFIVYVIQTYSKNLFGVVLTIDKSHIFYRITKYQLLAYKLQVNTTTTNNDVVIPIINLILLVGSKSIQI